jgi:hypothetical protein
MTTGKKLVLQYLVADIQRDHYNGVLKLYI